METIYKENLSEIVDVYKILGMQISTDFNTLALAVNNLENESKLSTTEKPFIEKLSKSINKSGEDVELFSNSLESLNDDLNVIKLNPTLGKRILNLCNKIQEIANNGIDKLKKNLKILPKQIKQVFTGINKEIENEANMPKESIKEIEVQIKQLEDRIAELTASTLIISSAYSNIFANLQESINDANEINDEKFQSLNQKIILKKASTQPDIIDKNIEITPYTFSVPSELDMGAVSDLVLVWEFIKSDLLYTHNETFDSIFGGQENYSKFITNFETLLKENLNVFSNMQIFNYNFNYALQYIIITGSEESKESARYIKNNLEITFEMLSRDLLTTEQKKEVLQFFTKYKDILDLDNFGFNLNEIIKQTAESVNKLEEEQVDNDKQIEYTVSFNPIEELINWIKTLRAKNKNKSLDEEIEKDLEKTSEKEINQPLLQPTALTVLNETSVVEKPQVDRVVKDRRGKTKSYNYSIQIGKNGPYIPVKLYNLILKLGMLEKIEKFLNKFQNKYNTQIEL